MASEEAKRRHQQKRKGTTPNDSQRRRVKTRDGNRCVRCGATENLVVHHILPVNGTPLYWSEEARKQNLPEDYDLDALHRRVMADTNLATLCQSCHMAAHGGSFNGSSRDAYSGHHEFWVWALDPERFRFREMLTHLDGVEKDEADALAERFDTVEDAYEARTDGVAAVEGIERSTARSIVQSLAYHL